ncbi:response regulator [Nostoc sp. FACHB-152]|uniref:ATP-binding response regulator n=1 Tax=unclassified Nostoc TaxID=2593658 RepID=UPI001684871A|nr:MULTISPECIES: ATP-binding protein [unclassified Nostoc]MBD2449037.1 response regulator [Nostoc sp. FACHB-152]MBD2469768.1 response regulator [Nostoc sp. FACHB-145]
MYSQPLEIPKANILVIDDTPENLHLLASMLTEQGYKVRSVTKGAAGLRGAQAAPPDLIVLDINMPEMNGYEVCQHLKNHPQTCDIPVIFISAMNDVIDKVKAFTVGGVDYITKPFQVEEVLARVENHLTIRNLQKQLQAQNIRLQEEIRERQQAEEKFTKAFRSSPSPIAITTFSDGCFIEVNSSFLKISGYNLAEIIGHSVADLNLGISQQQNAHIWQKLIETGSLQNQEIELLTKSGEKRIVLLSAELIDLAATQCVLNIFNDITERKRLENEFISLVSHELRTPLTSLIGSLDLLGTGQLGTLTAKGQQVLNIATTNIERLNRLVNDILDLERMKSGKITTQPSLCNIGDLLIQATEAMQAMAERSQINLVVEPATAQIWADPDRMLQTLTNLIGNAIKFSQPGGNVWLRVKLQTDSLQIEVQDQGRGIPENKLQSIFERFGQVDVSDSRKKGGTGLGLAICRNIVEQHHGKIWVQSTLGQGSTFYIILPLLNGGL